MDPPGSVLIASDCPPSPPSLRPIGNLRQSGPTVVPDSYFVIHGSKDSDVFTFEGYHTYERAHAVDLANTTVSDGKFKAMLWVHKANHNQFNSIWASETAPGVAMPRASQDEIAKVHLGALAQAVLLDRAEYLDVLRD